MNTATKKGTSKDRARVSTHLNKSYVFIVVYDKTFNLKVFFLSVMF